LSTYIFPCLKRSIFDFALKKFAMICMAGPLFCCDLEFRRYLSLLSFYRIFCISFTLLLLFSCEIVLLKVDFLCMLSVVSSGFALFSMPICDEEVIVDSNRD
jgi:hypothetical protein